MHLSISTGSLPTSSCTSVPQEPTTPFRSKSVYCSPLRKSLGATASLRPEPQTPGPLGVWESGA